MLLSKLLQWLTTDHMCKNFFLSLYLFFVYDYIYCNSCQIYHLKQHHIFGLMASILCTVKSNVDFNPACISLLTLPRAGGSNYPLVDLTLPSRLGLKAYEDMLCILLVELSLNISMEMYRK